jgi:hypothetical protein
MNNQILLPVSFGEYYDKLSILMLKKAKVTDPSRLRHIETEYSYFIRHEAYDKDFLQNELFLELYRINEFLWSSEDTIREYLSESLGQSTVGDLANPRKSDFVSHVVANFRNNDTRYKAKAKIDQHFCSFIREQKSYSYLSTNG